MSLSAIFTGLNGISSLASMLGGDSAVAQAKKAQQAAINQYQQSGDQQYQDLVGNQNRTLYSQAGTAGDAIRNLGSRLGSSLASAGVYNSSATAGALAQGQQNSDAALADLGARYDFNARNLRDQNSQNVANMQYGFAKQNYGQALNQQAAGTQGFQSWLGGLGQSLLQGSGANKSKGAAAGTGVNGVQGDWNVNQPGNSGNPNPILGGMQSVTPSWQHPITALMQRPRINFGFGSPGSGGF